MEQEIIKLLSGKKNLALTNIEINDYLKLKTPEELNELEKILDKFFKNDGVFFLGSTDILPPPLDKNIEEDLVRKCNAGDINARNKLIEHNLRLVVFLSKKYDGSIYDLEDLVSIGSIGLIKAISTYKLDKNIKLATYASRCIDNEILMFLRKNKKRMNEVSFEDSINFDSEGNELHIEDVK